MTSSLPTRPNIEHLKKQAKQLLHAHGAGDESCCATLRNHSRFRAMSSSDILTDKVVLREVQHALAVEYGFKSWAEMRQVIRQKHEVSNQEDSEDCYRRFVSALLAHYQLDIGHAEPLPAPGCSGFPDAFRLTDEEGNRYKVNMREQEEGAHRETCAQMVWLLSMRQNTDISVPLPIPMKSGRYVKLMRLGDSSCAYQCSIVTWMPGRDVGAITSLRVWREMGATVARLHNYAGRFSPPPGFAIPTVCGCVAGDAKLWGEQTTTLCSVLTGHTKRLLEKCRDQVMAVLGQLVTPRKDRMVIHGGLWSGNATAYKNIVHLIDFEHISWGLPAYDMASFRYYELYHNALVGNIGGSASLSQTKAFEQGYGGVRPLPDTCLTDMLTVKHIVDTANERGYAKDPNAMRRAEQLLATLMA